MKKYILAFVILMITVILSSCADVSNVDKCLTEEPYGFWFGLWHGAIVPFSWIGSLFSDDIAIYAINNNGGWYDFGFILGVGGLGFGSSKSTR
jgi:hypothetical protein